MLWNVTLGKVIGEPDNLGWTQIYEFKPQDELLLKIRGQVWAIISINSHSGNDQVFSGREIISRLHEEYFGKRQVDALPALKRSIEVVSEEFSDTGKLEITAICLIDEIVYLIASGGARIFLLREGNLVPLLENGSEVISASGTPKDKDLFVLGTQHFFEIVKPGIIKGSIEGKSLNEAVEAIAPTIHFQEKEGNLGGLFLNFEKKDLEPNQKVDLQSVTYKFEKFLNKHKNLKLYVKEDQLDEVSHKKKLISSVGILLLLILSVSIFFGIKQKRLNDYKTSYEKELLSAQHELEEAEALFTLNQDRSRELFESAQNKILSLSNQEIEDPKLTLLEDKISKNQGKILGEYKTMEEIFVDLSLLSNGFKADEISSFENNLYVVDKVGKKIVKVAFDTKRSEVIAGPSQIEEVQKITAYSDRVFFLNSKGLFELGEGKVIDADWEGNVLPFAYASNIYILDKGNSKIFRYSSIEGGFGTKKEWLAPGVSVDLSNSSQILIDGSIWILTQNSKILKFTLGNPQNFTIKSAAEIQSIKAIYTNEDLEYFYVLEPANKKVVILTKEGEYKAQYTSDIISETRGFVVSESQKKIILMTNDKLFSMEIKHL